MKSKKNNYKLKIADLDLYNSFKKRIKNTIKNKSEIYKTIMLYIKIFKVVKNEFRLFQYQLERTQPKISKEIKTGGIVCNFDSEKEKGKILKELKKEVINKPGDIVKDKRGNVIGVISKENEIITNGRINNYGIVNDLTPIWKRKMKRSDFK